MVDKISAPDDYTVVFDLKYASPASCRPSPRLSTSSTLRRIWKSTHGLAPKEHQRHGRLVRAAPTGCVRWKARPARAITIWVRTASRFHISTATKRFPRRKWRFAFRPSVATVPRLSSVVSRRKLVTIWSMPWAIRLPSKRATGTA